MAREATALLNDQSAGACRRVAVAAVEIPRRRFERVEDAAGALDVRWVTA